jgi:hypothetical protein
VNPATIDVSSRSECPLGQLFGSYERGLFTLDLSDYAVIGLGFNIGTGDLAYKQLSYEWRRIVRGRRAKH